MGKLTLSADPAVIARAKRLARRHGTSVSAMFERLIRGMADGPAATRSVGPLTRRASGIIALPRGKTDRQVLEEALAGKYGTRP
jgi:hypothetical protein